LPSPKGPALKLKMSENQSPEGQQDVVISSGRSSHLRGTDSDFLKDKAVLAVQVSLWSGTKTIGDDELHLLGISDVKEFRKDHTPGSKFLATKKSLAPMASAKSGIWGNVTLISSAFFTQNLRLVREEFVDEIVESIQTGELELKSAVETFLSERYEAEKEQYYLRSVASCPSLSRFEILSTYPTPDTIRVKHRVSFAIIRTPANGAISRAVDLYCRQKMDEEVRSVIEESSESIRAMLAGVVNDFKVTLSGKDPEDKINSRTVKRLDNAMTRFLKMAPTFGDTRISEAVSECRRQLASMGGWLRSDVDSSDLPGAIHQVSLAVADVDLIQRERTAFIGEIIGNIDDVSLSPAIGVFDPSSINQGSVFAGEEPMELY